MPWLVDRRPLNMDLYIYYRVPAAKATEFHAAAAMMQAGLEKSSGVKALLKRRPEADGGLHTWMEVYADVPGGFEGLLAGALEGSALPSLIASDRYIEKFMDQA